MQLRLPGIRRAPFIQQGSRWRYSWEIATGCSTSHVIEHTLSKGGSSLFFCLSYSVCQMSDLQYYNESKRTQYCTVYDKKSKKHHIWRLFTCYWCFYNFAHVVYTTC